MRCSLLFLCLFFRVLFVEVHGLKEVQGLKSKGRCTFWTVLAADEVKAKSFIFLGFSSEALVSFLFFGLVEGVFRALPFGRPSPEEQTAKWTLNSLVSPEAGIVAIGSMLL